MKKKIVKSSVKMSELLQMHAVAIGEVQNVGFRQATKTYAETFHLKGVVQNLEDGDVEIIAQGSKEDLENLLESLKKHFGRSIHAFSSQYTPIQEAYTSFEIKK